MPTNSSHPSGRVKLGCPNCRQQQLARIARQGFLRNHVFPFFGLYPWQCARCGRQYLVPRRAAGYRQTAVPAEVELSTSLPDETLEVR